MASPISLSSSALHLYQLPTDLLTPIFHFLVPPLQNGSNISLVCKQWKQVLDTKFFWKELFAHCGIPFPHSLSAATDNFVKKASIAYQYMAASRLRNIMTGHTNSAIIKEIPVNINLSTYDHILFFEDTHVIAYHEHEISICSLVNPKAVTQWQTPHKILSLCVIGGIIYCGRENEKGREIAVCPFDVSSTDYALLDVEKADLPTSSFMPFMQLFASDQWLISITEKSLKKWDREKGTLKETIPFTPGMQQFHLNGNTLYWTKLFNQSLYFWDLNSGFSSKWELIFPPDTSCRMHVHGSVCTFIEAPLFGPYGNSSEESGSGEDALTIVSVNLVTGAKKRYPIATQGYHENPFITSFNDLLIFGRDAYDPMVTYDDDMVMDDPEILEWIDLEKRVVLFQMQKYSIHNAQRKWSISAFQNTLLFATTDNKFVTISFLDPKK